MRRHSVITNRWMVESNADNSPIYQIVDVNALQDHVCIFPFAPNSPYVFELRSKEEWPSEFVSEYNNFEEVLGGAAHNYDLTESSDSDLSSIDEHGIDSD